MTTEELARLTPAQKRVKIAEACGVKCGRCNGTGEYLRYGSHDWFRQCIGSGPRASREQPPVKCDHATPDFHKHGALIPDYFHSLDAMHEAEKGLFSTKLEAECEYRDNLIKVVRSCQPDGFVFAIDCISATAAQRADAFLLTI